MLMEGVNESFTDEPRIQRAWISRGQNIVLNNRPEADAASFRNSFFHRGFKYRPVTCGEVQFLSRGEVLGDYQRFIYVGVQSSHLESDVPNPGTKSGMGELSSGVFSRVTCIVMLWETELSPLDVALRVCSKSVTLFAQVCTCP